MQLPDFATGATPPPSCPHTSRRAGQAQRSPEPPGEHSPLPSHAANCGGAERGRYSPLAHTPQPSVPPPLLAATRILHCVLRQWRRCGETADARGAVLALASGGDHTARRVRRLLAWLHPDKLGGATLSAAQDAVLTAARTVAEACRRPVGAEWKQADKEVAAVAADVPLHEDWYERCTSCPSRSGPGTACKCAVTACMPPAAPRPRRAASCQPRAELRPGGQKRPDRSLLEAEELRRKWAGAPPPRRPRRTQAAQQLPASPAEQSPRAAEPAAPSVSARSPEQERAAAAPRPSSAEGTISIVRALGLCGRKADIRQVRSSVVRPFIIMPVRIHAVARVTSTATYGHLPHIKFPLGSIIVVN